MLPDPQGHRLTAGEGEAPATFWAWWGAQTLAVPHTPRPRVAPKLNANGGV